MIRKFTLLTLLLGLTVQVNASESEFFVREDINKLNIRTDVNSLENVLDKVEKFVGKNQKYIDENMFIIECYSSRCERFSKEITVNLLNKGKSDNYIRVNSISSKLGAKYDMVFKLVQYKVMKPNCGKLSVMDFDDDWYTTDMTNVEYDRYCSSLYLDTLSSKNLDKKLNLDGGSE